MTLERIDDVPKPCLHREHDPPKHIALRPGRYRHTCPGCHKTTVFTVHQFVASTGYGRNGESDHSYFGPNDK